MSYDISINESTLNTTYNHSKMWRATTIGTVGEPIGIYIIDKKCGDVARGYLTEMHKYMVRNREELLPLQPSNGWGSYDEAVRVLNELILLSLTFPDSEFNIS